MGFGFFHSNGDTSLSLDYLCVSNDRDEKSGAWCITYASTSTMVSYSKYLFLGAPFVALATLGVLWWQKREKKRTFMEVGRVTELFVYPVKSCKGIKLTEARCLKEGMEFDR